MKRTQPNLILAIPFVCVVGLFAIGVISVTSINEVFKNPHKETKR
jgi:hypothetical protein